MTGADVIKEYLVSIGVQVDTPAYMKLKRALSDIDGTINKSAMGWTRAFGLAGTAIVGTLGAIIATTVNMMRKVSDSDIVFQKYARRMLINESAAKSLKRATDAMGESLEDIAWNPELRSRFFSLVKDQRTMSTPGEAKGMRKELRDITHEWTRMQVIAKYAMEWITYHLGKILGKEFKSLRDMFKSINDWLIKKMPEWTQKVAYFLAGVINIARSVIVVLKGVYSVLQSLWQSLPELGKAFAIFAGIVGAFFLSNPFGQALMMIGMVLLMLEDYVAFTEGRKSVDFLKPLWVSVNRIMPVIKKSFTEVTDVVSRFFKLFEGKNYVLTTFALAIKMLAESILILAEHGERAMKNIETIKQSFTDSKSVKPKQVMDLLSPVPMDTGERWLGKALGKALKLVSPESLKRLEETYKDRKEKGLPVSGLAESLLSSAGVDVYVYLDKNAEAAGFRGTVEIKHKDIKGLDKKTIPTSQ